MGQASGRIKQGDPSQTQASWVTVVGKLHRRLVYGRRVDTLARHFAEILPPDASILDVGCGDGLIDRLILGRRPDVSISGIDVFLRPKAHIPVSQFDGKVIPYTRKTFDVVMFVDALHHTGDPMVLLKEARRVARKLILIKDHNCEGFAAWPILRLMDWVGNAPYGVKLTYNYWSERRWRSAFSELELPVREYRRTLGLYPVPARFLFERQLHFICSLDVGG